MSMKNDLIFLGSNTNVHWYGDIAKRMGLNLLGMIDDDYHGQGKFQDIPILATQQELIDNPSRFNGCKFYCVVNWQPPDIKYDYIVRNNNKRKSFLNIIDTLGLDETSLISPSAEIGSYNVKLGKGIFIDSFCNIMPNVSIGNRTIIQNHSNIGDGVTIGDNCNFKCKTLINGPSTIGNNVYMGMNSSIQRLYLNIADGTFVHPGIMVLRDTQPNEVIGLHGKDLRKIYNNITQG